MDPATAKIDVYRASKKLAEKVAEEFVQEFDPPFSVVTLCPPLVFGPIINEQSLENINASNAGIWDFLNGKIESITPNRLHLWVDVRDLGEVHARSVEVDLGTSKYERYFIVADEMYSNQDTTDILRKARSAIYATEREF
jgi:nucleoside-diphosphate-sugar epimerase